MDQPHLVYPCKWHTVYYHLYAAQVMVLHHPIHRVSKKQMPHNTRYTIKCTLPIIMHILSHAHGVLAAIQSIYADSSKSDTTSICSSDASTSSDESNLDDTSYTSDTDSNTSIIDSDIGSKEPSNVDLIHGTIDGCVHCNN